VAAAASNAASSAGQTLQQQLDAAKAQIAQLQSQAAEGLRQRNIISSTTKDETAAPKSTTGPTATAGLAQHPPAEGVPVQIVAALCLLSFLLAYFFF
jgi:hypothetical protein